MLLVADAVGALVKVLTSAAGAPFSTETPSTVPTRYGRVQHLPGDRTDLVIDEQNFLIRVWAESAYQAWLLARTAQAVVCGLEGSIAHGVMFLAAEATLPAWFPDPDTRGPSYLFTATLTTEAVETPKE